MNNSKLIRLLKLIEPEEIKDFTKFLKSPFFNSNKQCLSLYSYLSIHHPSFNSPKLAKEKVFKKLFPGRKYNYNILSNLMSQLTALTEEYLLNLQFQKEGFTKKKMLARALGERKNTYDLFQKKNEALIKAVEDGKIRGINYYNELRSLNHDLYYHPMTNRQATGIGGIKKAMDNLDMMFAQTKLLYCLELRAREYLIGEQHNIILKRGITGPGGRIICRKKSGMFNLFKNPPAV